MSAQRASTIRQHGSAAADDLVAAEIAPFVRLLEIRDADTARHCARVAHVVAALGERLGLTGESLHELQQAAWLHDLGKIGVPDAILLKAGPLTPQEWEVMQCHPAWGALALQRADTLGDIADSVRFHHERWDGCGYPSGLVGEAIPFASRVIGACDALCAVTEARPYRPPLDLVAAKKVLRAGAGSHFEPGLVDELIALVDARPALIDGDTGQAPAAIDSGQVARGARFRRAQPAAAPVLAPGLGSALVAAGGLPALLESRERLLRLLSDLNPHAGRIADVIETDPGLTAAVLREAALLGSGKDGGDGVAAAVDAVGFDRLSACAAGVEVFDVLDRHRSSRMDPEQFRLHAIAVRRASQAVAQAIDHRATDELAAMALLHDVGKLAFARADLRYPVEVLSGARTPEERVRAERRAFGLDHAAASAVMLRRWGLPERLAVGVGRHHDPEGSPDALVIGLADMLAHHAAGGAVGRGTLLQAAAGLGLTLADVRTILFELDAPVTEPRHRRHEDSPLTNAEVTVLRGVAAGKRNKQLAQELRVSPSTVRSHLYNTYAKLGVGDRARAVLVATDRGWI